MSPFEQVSVFVLLSPPSRTAVYRTEKRGIRRGKEKGKNRDRI